MLRYKTETRPGLVALYDIRPGNGAGQFLQPRSPHGAEVLNTTQMYIQSRSDNIADDAISLNILLSVTAAATDELCIKLAVMVGERPDLSAINGVGPLVTPIKRCIMHCWKHLPDSRPTFTGI